MFDAPFRRSEPGGGDDDQGQRRRWPPRRRAPGGGGPPDWSDPAVRDAHNRRALLSVGLGIAVAFLIASVMPQPVVLAAFREILFFGAMGVGVVSAMRREPILGAPVFTGWDRAAMMMLAAQLSGAFIDHDAVESYLLQVQESGQF